MLNKKYLLLGILFIVFILAFFVFVNKEHPTEPFIENEDEELLTEEEKTEIESENSVKTEVEGLSEDGQKIEFVEEELVSAPDLESTIIFPDSYSEEAQEILLEKVEKIKEALKNDPKSVGNWIELGIFRKMIEDYEGAEEIWLYAGYLNPKNSVIWSNLGDLYALYIKDNEKAEEFYLKSLEYGYKQEHLYFKIADFYKDYMKDLEKARETVELGLEHNPNSQSLKDLLNSLK